jgi:hypothetical protein
MTCREEILAAFQLLEARKRTDTFQLQEIVEAVLARTDRYPESTIRTHISSHMCADSPDHADVTYGDLERVRRGWYRRRRRGAQRPAPPAPPSRPPDASPKAEEGLSEDEVKQHLQRWLQGQGWTCRIAWGKERGIDVEATRGEERWVIEAKGCGSRPQMRVNYFLAILGETLQRMDDPKARYSIALPDMAQYRGLWERLPALAKQRTGITLLLVGADRGVEEVG